MRAPFACLTLASSLALLAGCDDCNKKPTPAAPSATPSASASAAPASALDKPCGDYATALCDRLKGCEGGASLKWRFNDEGTCKQRAKLECTARLGAPEVTAPADMDACNKAIAAQACDEAGAGAVPAACRGKGKRSNGAACASDDQCESQLCDRAGLGGDRSLDALLGGGNTDGPPLDCGKCVAPAKEGDVCLNPMVGTSASCARGLACEGDNVIKCVKPKRPDSPVARLGEGECKGDEGCLEPAVCVRGKCKVLDATACK